jgi:transcriptional regulator with XRE-family HTH domain
VEDVLGILAGNIRRLRRERKLTQDALAERASMDASEIRRIESARREPGVNVLVRLARGLGVRPGDLFEGIE